MIQVNLANPKRKWKIWRDEHWGTDWNNRYEQGYIIGTADDAEAELLSKYAEAEQPYVEFYGDENVVLAELLYCERCCKPCQLCRCAAEGHDDEVSVACFHAVAEETKCA